MNTFQLFGISLSGVLVVSAFIGAGYLWFRDLQRYVSKHRKETS